MENNLRLWRAPHRESSSHVWAKLQTFKNTCDLPWLVVGDFNEPLWDFEHVSTTPRAESQMIAFRDTLEMCELADLGFLAFPSHMITKGVEQVTWR